MLKVVILLFVAVCSAQIPDFIDNTEQLQKKIAHGVTTAVGWETNALTHYYNQQKLPLTYAVDVELDLKEVWNGLESQYQSLKNARADFIAQNPKARVKCLDQLINDGQTYLQRMGLKVGAAYKNVMIPLNSQIDFLFSNMNRIWDILYKENAYSGESQSNVLQRLDQISAIDSVGVTGVYDQKLKVQRNAIKESYKVILTDMQRRVVDIIGDFGLCL